MQSESTTRRIPYVTNLPVSIRRAALARYGTRCLLCGTTERIQVDHIVPYVLGGSDELDNLQVLCKACNVRKRQNVVDYRASPEQCARRWQLFVEAQALHDRLCAVEDSLPRGDDRRRIQALRLRASDRFRRRIGLPSRQALLMIWTARYD
jgi:hypothetical protein